MFASILLDTAEELKVPALWFPNITLPLLYAVLTEVLVFSQHLIGV